MVRPKDQFWEYAEDLKNGRFSCNFCHRKFSGGISRIKWHLSGRKCHDIKVCEQVPRLIQLEVRKVLDTPNKKADRSSQVEDENHSILSLSRGPNLYTENDSILVGRNNNNVRDQGDNDLSTLASSSRAPNACNENEKYCQVVLDEQLAKLFFLFGIHPMAVVSPIFEDFVKSIVEYGPGYQPPSPFSLGTELMSNVEMKAQEYVKNVIINDSFQACCTLMVNIWVDYNDFNRNVNYLMDIFAYSQRGVVCLNSCNYGSRKGIQEAISSAIELLGLSHVLQVLIYYDFKGHTFNKDFSKIRNMQIFENHPWICVNHCAAAVIDDFLCIMECPKLDSVIELVRLILSYSFHHSNVSFRRGKKSPKEYYASIIFMFKSVLDVEDELQTVQFSMITLSSDRVKLLDEQKVAEHLRCAKFIDYIIRRKEFWSRVKAAAQVLFLLFQTRCLVNEDSSIGYLYEMIERLSDGIDKSRNYDCFLYDFIWETFSDMRKKIIHPIHAAAAFLNPTFMSSDNFKENVEMIDGMNYVFENMVESEEKEAFTKEVHQYRTKMPKLFTAQAMTMLKTWHPQMWWDFCGKHTPVLRKYAIRILSQPCTTSICKRYQVPRGDRRSEDNEDWSVKVNTMIMSSNNYSESLRLEPIILDKLGGEDHDAFKDVLELVDEDYMDVLPEFTDDTLDRVIEDQRLSWLDDFPDSFCFI